MVCPHCFSDLQIRGWQCCHLIRDDLQSATDTASTDDSLRSPVATSHPQEDSHLSIQHRYCKQYNEPNAKVCKSCGNGDHRDEACSQCKKPLPDGWGESTPLTVAFLGESGSGKTSYMIALHDWWEKKLYRFGFAFRPLMSALLQTEFQEMKAEVLDRNRVHERTAEERRYSFIWEIRSIQKGSQTRNHLWDFLRFSRPDKPLQFYYHDTAGENLNDLDRTASRSTYIKNASYLIYFIDLEECLPGTATTSDGKHGTTDQYRPLNSVIRLLRKEANEHSKPLNLPIAICLNKLDMALKLYPDLKQSLEPAPTHGLHGFDSQAVQHRSEVISRFMAEELKMGNFVANITAHFRDIMYFPTATFGEDLSQPTPSSQQGFFPISVEDPFLWIMSKEKHL